MCETTIRWVTEGLETFGGLAKGRVCLGIETVDGGRLFHSLFFAFTGIPCSMELVLDGFFSWFGRKGIEKGNGGGSIQYT